ncbi:MAG TPA: glycosyltransferase, partial [Anaerolineales bacterium]|nr:glycosyltransferase [Anaerolineales bacterium]
ADNFSSRMDLCLVASAEARQIAIKQRVSQEKICLIGHPIQPEFLSISADKSEILKRVGSGEELPTVLVSGGGEGWGRIAGVVAALHVARLPIQLVVVCGHNRKLYERLNRREFTIPSRILGFISPKEMSALLQTAYLIVAKAGPNTIFEAFQAGLPTILFDVVRGQEEGNVDYICKHAAGFFCTSPRKVAKMVEALLTDRSLYKEISAHARSLATPTAAFDMAKVCYSLIECQPYES